MLTSVVFIGAVLCAVGFMAWLAFFILNRGFNTMLETRKEAWRNSRNSLLLGVLLLAGAIGLGYQFFQMEPPLPVPPINPGMSLNETPDVMGPTEDQTLVAGALVLSVVAFLLWAGVFAFNRNFNSSLRTARESRNASFGQLVFGGALLCLVIVLGAAYFQLERTPVIPAGYVVEADEVEVQVVVPAEEAAAAASAHAVTTDVIVEGEE